MAQVLECSRSLAPVHAVWHHHNFRAQIVAKQASLPLVDWHTGPGWLRRLVVGRDISVQGPQQDHGHHPGPRKNAEGWHQMLRLRALEKMREPHGLVIPPGSNPTIDRCLKSPGPQVWAQLASPIPVVSFWSTHRSQPRHRKTKIKSEFKIANQ